MGKSNPEEREIKGEALEGPANQLTTKNVIGPPDRALFKIISPLVLLAP